MKKIYSLILLTALCYSTAWAEELTISEGSSTATAVGSVPFEGNSGDYYQHVQIIYSKSEFSSLASMAGKSITKLTFYLKSAIAVEWGAEVTISLAEVSESSFSSTSYNGASLTAVYTGPIDGRVATMEFEFDTPFEYSGEKNILFDLQTSKKGTAYKSASFSGKGNYDSQYCLYKASSSSMPTTGTRAYFVPKTTFTYEEASGTACAKPKSPAKKSASFESLTFSWTEADSCEYSLVEKDVEPTAWTKLNKGDVEVTIDGLYTSKVYDFYVRNLCADETHTDSVWVKAVSPVCNAPADPTASAITASTATVSWTAAAGEGINKYQYLCISSGDPDWSVAKETTETSVDLSELNASTGYTFYVRAWHSDKSQSAAVYVAFNTACGAVDAPWSEDFQSFSGDEVPACWDNSGSTSTNTSDNYYVWGIYKPYSDDNKMMRMCNFMVKPGASSGGSITQINSPTINIPASPAQELTFDYIHTSDAGDLTVKISIDNGENFTDLGTYKKGSKAYYQNPVDEDWQEAAINLSAYAGKSVILQFYAPANYSNGAIFVDNVDIHKAPVCIKPTDVAASEISDKSAKIAWTAAEGQTAWKIEYSKNSDFSESTVVNADANPKVISGLSASTIYYVHVKSDCSASGDGESDWSASASFTTECAPQALPFAEDFESVVAGWGEYNVPDCWKKINDGTEYYDYPYVNTSNPHSGDNALYFAGQKEKYIVLPLFEKAVNLLSISLWYNCDADATADLGYYKNGSFTSLLSLSTKDVYTEVDEYPLSAAPADAQIAIRYSASNGYAPLYIDDIAVIETPSCAKPTGLKADATTSSSATLSWTSSASAWNIKYVAANGTDTLTAPANANPFTLSGLAASTSYKAVVQADCGGGDKSDWCKDTLIFTTKDGCAQPENLAVTNRPDGAYFTWKAGNGETTFEYHLGDENWTALAENVLEYTISGKASGTEGDFYVRAACGSVAASIHYSALCPAPTAPKIANISTTSATLSWTAAAGIVNYQYKLNDGEWTKVEGATSVELTSLNPSTSYTAYVRSFYSDASQSADVNVAFTTNCAAVAELPWSENFEGLSELPICWETAGPGAASIEVSKGLSYGLELENDGLFFSGEGATYAYAILPEFEATLSTLEIVFSHIEESAESGKCGNMELGYYKDEAFTSLKAYDLVTTMTQEDAYALTSVPAGARIAFAYKASSTNWAAAVDNIIVRVQGSATGIEGTQSTEISTLKAIENGQLIIIREGEKFNAQGAKIK